MVAIAKALSMDAQIVIMDKPTCPPHCEEEVAELFRTVRKLKERGVAVIYISHRLEEIWMSATVPLSCAMGVTLGRSRCTRLTSTN